MNALHAPLRAHFAALAPGWRAPLSTFLDGAAHAALCAFVDAQVAAGRRVYPARPLAALESGAPQDVRVVILGQDPYHGPGQAHGYAFSVPAGIRPPPSLRNVLQELARDQGPAAQAGTGSLLHWSGQGVLLLNTVLTVEQDAPGSHAGRGWEAFTDAIIDHLAGAPGARAFLLWGAQAQAKRPRIEAAMALRTGTPPLVLAANHPSPLSARRPPQPFIGCGHFSRANRYLEESGLAPIRW